jgi:hypothetical protein
MSKVTSLKRARLARMTPEERAERRRRQRLYRDQVKTNEGFRREFTERVTAAAIQKIKGLRELNLANIETICNQALDELKAEQPELFVLPVWGPIPKPF